MSQRHPWSMTATLLMLVLSVAITSSPVAARRATFTLHFPAGIDVSTVQGLWPVRSRKGRNIVVEPTAEQEQLGRLKLLMFVPGYQFVRMNIDLTSDVHEADVALTSLPPFHVTGHVSPDGVDLDGASLSVTMIVDVPPEGNVTRIDGPGAAFDLGERTLSASGRYAFAIDLPDVGRDPLMGKPGGGVDFAFVARPREGRLLFLWHTFPDSLVEPALASYPPDLVLRPKKR